MFASSVRAGIALQNQLCTAGCNQLGEVQCCKVGTSHHLSLCQTVCQTLRSYPCELPQAPAALPPLNLTVLGDDGVAAGASDNLCSTVYVGS